MKFTHLLSALLAFGAITLTPAVMSAAEDHENHEVIEKVMKEGLKGDESPLALVLAGQATPEDTADLNKLIQTMKGTHAPKGEQADYDTKVGELIAAMEAVAKGDTSDAARKRLDEAANCKACHTDHKPKK